MTNLTDIEYEILTQEREAYFSELRAMYGIPVGADLPDNIKQQAKPVLLRVLKEMRKPYQDLKRIIYPQNL